MNKPIARRGLVVVDFDDTIAPDSASAISPAVASCLWRLATRAPVAVVTARTREKAVTTARSALAAAGLGTLPLLVRDRAQHDHSEAGITEAKRIAIAEHARERGLLPAIGIGDRPTDEIAYRSLGMLVVRMRHGGRSYAWVGEADLEVLIEDGLLDRAWCDLPERIGALWARQ